MAFSCWHFYSFFSAHFWLRQIWQFIKRILYFISSGFTGNFIKVQQGSWEKEWDNFKKGKARHSCEEFLSTIHSQVEHFSGSGSKKNNKLSFFSNFLMPHDHQCTVCDGCTTNVLQQYSTYSCIGFRKCFFGCFYLYSSPMPPSLRPPPPPPPAPLLH